MVQGSEHILNEFHSSDYATEAEKDEFAQKQITQGKEACSSNECTFTYDYKKGKKLKLEITYSESQASSVIGTGMSKYNADELYEKLRSGVESGGLDGSVYTCE